MVQVLGTVTTIKSVEMRVFVGDIDKVNDVCWSRRAELIPLSRILREAAVMRLGLKLAGGVRVKVLIAKAPEAADSKVLTIILPGVS